MNGTLRLGFATSTAFNPQVFALLHRFRDKYPGMVLEPLEKDMAGLMTAMSEGALDAAFIRLPCERSKEFSFKVLDIGGNDGGAAQNPSAQSGKGKSGCRRCATIR